MTQQSLPHLPLGLILRNHGSFCSFLLKLMDFSSYG